MVGTADITGNTKITGTADITGDVAITGAIAHTKDTQSTTSTTGAIVTAGGLGIAKNTYIGGNLDVGGDVNAPGITEDSDRRLKKDIRTLTGALSDVTKLRGVVYSWREAGGRHTGTGKRYPLGRHPGLIAQEVEEVVPSSVHTNEKGWKSVSYTRLIPFLVESIKELHIRAEAQQRVIEEQQRRLAALEGVLADELPRPGSSSAPAA